MRKLTKAERRALRAAVATWAVARPEATAPTVHELVVWLRADRSLGIEPAAYDGVTVRALLLELGLTIRG